MAEESCLNNNVFNLRKEAGFSRKAISEYLNVTPYKIMRYEKVGNYIPLEHVQKLAILFCVNEYDLFTNEKLTPSFTPLINKKTINKNTIQIAKFYKIVQNYFAMSIGLENKSQDEIK